MTQETDNTTPGVAQSNEISTIYLAGPVAYDDNPQGWRNNMKRRFESKTDVGFLDPLDKYDLSDGVPEEDEVTPKEIVESDKTMIDMADAVLARYDEVVSVGTPMEIMYTYEQNRQNSYSKPIVIWYDSDSQDSLSPWYLHHADEIRNYPGEALLAATDLVKERKTAEARLAYP